MKTPLEQTSQYIVESKSRSCGRAFEPRTEREGQRRERHLVQSVENMYLGSVLNRVQTCMPSYSMQKGLHLSRQIVEFSSSGFRRGAWVVFIGVP